MLKRQIGRYNRSKIHIVHGLGLRPDSEIQLNNLANLTGKGGPDGSPDGGVRGATEFQQGALGIADRSQTTVAQCGGWCGVEKSFEYPPLPPSLATKLYHTVLPQEFC
jgi:hypothetical protein